MSSEEAGSGNTVARYSQITALWYLSQHIFSTHRQPTTEIEKRLLCIRIKLFKASNGMSSRRNLIPNSQQRYLSLSNIQVFSSMFHRNSSTNKRPNGKVFQIPENWISLKDFGSCLCRPFRSTLNLTLNLSCEQICLASQDSSLARYDYMTTCSACRRDAGLPAPPPIAIQGHIKNERRS